MTTESNIAIVRGLVEQVRTEFHALLTSNEEGPEYGRKLQAMSIRLDNYIWVLEDLIKGL